MAEILKIREITIDTMQHKDFATKEEELKLIRFYQNDLNSAKLLINVTHDKVVTDFSAATSVQIAFLKPDCKRVFQDVQNVNQMQGKYYVVLSAQTLIAYGNVIAQLRFTFSNNKVIETCKFAFTVDESIMSDEAMESTNEFPVIQKAIEAGKKLEGVDIDGIIAAGELAKGAVKKSGDTMTGSLNIANTKVIDFLTPTSKFTLGTSTSEASPDRLYLYDNKNGKTILDYNANNGGLLTVIGESNLLKNTGGSIKGTMIMESGDFRFKNVANDVLLRNNASGIFSFFDIAQNQVVWTYNPATKGFNVNTTTNLVKKSRDTMTGDLTIKKDGASLNFSTVGGSRNARIFYNANEASDSGLNIQTPNGKLLLRDGSNITREVATKEKDGRADITLTAEAELIGSYGVIVDRRGNTVTLRAPIRRKVGSTNGVVFTLPVNMRPTMTLIQSVITKDGTIAELQLSATSGEVQLLGGNASITGKDCNIVITYVVD